MAKSDWWFKFEHLKWLTDEQLNRCSLETQGFWMRCICMMRKADSGKIEGTVAELARLLSVTPSEFKRCFAELNLTKTASVTQTSAIFTIMSRKFTKELKVREQNRLRKAKERRHASVTDASQDRVISKSKELDKKEEKREAIASPLTFEPDRFNHPAVVEFEAAFGFTPGSGFATSVARKVTRLDIWKQLLENKRAFADKPLIERRKVCNWILDEYDNRTKDIPKKLPTVDEVLRDRAEGLRPENRIPPPPVPIRPVIQPNYNKS
jgi:hypothetical protein